MTSTINIFARHGIYPFPGSKAQLPSESGPLPPAHVLIADVDALELEKERLAHDSSPNHPEGHCPCLLTPLPSPVDSVTEDEDDEPLPAYLQDSWINFLQLRELYVKASEHERWVFYGVPICTVSHAPSYICPNLSAALRRETNMLIPADENQVEGTQEPAGDLLELPLLLAPSEPSAVIFDSEPSDGLYLMQGVSVAHVINGLDRLVDPDEVAFEDEVDSFATLSIKWPCGEREARWRVSHFRICCEHGRMTRHALVSKICFEYASMIEECGQVVVDGHGVVACDVGDIRLLSLEPGEHGFWEPKIVVLLRR